MNAFRPLLASVTLLFLGAAPRLLAQAVDQTALENFKSDVHELDEMKKAEEAKSKLDPAAGVTMMHKLVAKMRTVRTEGLPAELKNGYAEMVAAVAKMEKIFEGWPETGAEFQAYVQKKATDDPEFLPKLQASINEAKTEITTVAQKMKEVGKKYGIDSLGKVADDAAK